MFRRRRHYHSQRLIQRRLPSRPALPEPLEDIAVDPQCDQLLRAAARRTANPPHETVALVNLGFRELLVGQLRRRLGVLGDLPRDLLTGRRVQLRQVAAQFALAPWHCTSSAKWPASPDRATG
jgi:hypothetical protein